MKKVKIKGNGTFAPIQKLISLGYNNFNNLPGYANSTYYYGEFDGNIKCFRNRIEDLDSYEEIFLCDDRQPEEKKPIEVQKLVRVYPNGYNSPTKELHKALEDGWLVKMITVIKCDNDQVADYILYKFIVK